MDYIELVGYAASILIAISLTMSNIFRLRVINLIGSITFSTYGFFVGAYPVFIVNLFIVFINLYYLSKLFHNRDRFEVLNVSDNSSYLNKFYRNYEKDMLNFFPKFEKKYFKEYESLFILRNLRPVNLVVYKKQENGIVEIFVDYAIPEYRDFLNGKYLLSVFSDSAGDKLTQLVSKTESKAHIAYLKKIGFRKNENNLYVMKV